MRGAFGHHSQSFSRKLSQEQQDRWIYAGAQVMSDPRLGQSGPLTGQQFYTSINSVRSRVDAPETFEPPAPVTFSPSPVGGLVITNDENGPRLRLRIEGELKEAVMVFGQEPCSAGRQKRRNLAYLGLLPPPVDGWSEVTYLYTSRYGEPRPGTKIFIVTCQEKDGWKAFDLETSARVPDRPRAPQATPTPDNAQNPYMYKGSTRDAEGTIAPVDGYPHGGNEPQTGGGIASGTPLDGARQGGGAEGGGSGPGS
jgi:hypothetical protein